MLRDGGLREVANEHGDDRLRDGVGDLVSGPLPRSYSSWTNRAVVDDEEPGDVIVLWERGQVERLAADLVAEPAQVPRRRGK